RARGAHVYGEVLGAGETCATRCPDADGRGLEAAARAALGCRHADGRAEPDVVFASGLGTIDDDLREADACRRLFPPPTPVQITASTGALGMTGAASGAFALVHGLLAMRSGTIPPTTGHERCDPRCAVPVVRGRRHCTLSHSLVWTSDGARHVALSIGSVS